MPGYDSWASFTKRFSSKQKWIMDKGLTKTGDSSSPTRWINNHPEPNDDFAAPYLENRVPAPGAQVDKFAIVNFDIVDDGNGVPLNQITINLEGNPAFANSQFVAPYNGALSSWTKLDDGRRWSFTIDKTDVWYGVVDVIVHVIATDYWSNTLNTSYTFESDLGAPWVDDRIPAEGGLIESQGLISFSVLDDNAGVDPSTIDAYIDGYWALSCDGYVWDFRAPFDGVDSDAYATSVGGDYGYYICFDRTSDHAGNFTVQVLADDYRGNSMDTTWALNTPNGPFMDSMDPASGSTCNARDTYISFDVLDDDYILQDTLDAYVNGFWAYKGAADTFVYPYDGYYSSVTATSVDGYDGYTVVIDRSTIYGVNVSLRVLAEDTVGNTMDNSAYNFTCDTAGPILETPTPANNSEGNPITQILTAPLRDYCTGVDQSSILVYIDDNLAYSGSTDTFSAPFNGGSSTITPVSDGYDIYIDHATYWDEVHNYSVTIYSRDNVGNLSTIGWKWATDIYTTFQLTAGSGVVQVPAQYDFNGDSKNPRLLYYAADATTSQWPERDSYGSTLLVSGSGDLMEPDVGSPLNGDEDNGVEFYSGKKYYSTDVTDGNITIEDFAVELLFKTGTTGDIVKKGVTKGWFVTQLSDKIAGRIYGSAGSASIESNTLETDCWYHVVFIYDVSGYLYMIVNGDLESKVSIGTIGTLNTTGILRIGDGFDGTVSYVAMWRGSDWVAGTDTEIEVYARKRFMKLTGAYPEITEGDDNPYAHGRQSVAYLDKVEGDNRYIYKIGAHWIRSCLRLDSSGNPFEGLLLEREIRNGVVYPIDFSSWTRYFYSGWPSASATLATSEVAPNKEKDVYCLIGLNTYSFPCAHYIYNTPVVSPSWCNTFSIWAKPCGSNQVNIAIVNTLVDEKIAAATFNLATESITKTHGKTAGLEDWGDGWKRIWVTAVDTIGQPEARIYTIGHGTASSVYIFGALLERAPSDSPSNFHPLVYPLSKKIDVMRFRGGDNFPDGTERIIESEVLFPDCDIMDDWSPTGDDGFNTIYEQSSLTGEPYIKLYIDHRNDRAMSRVPYSYGGKPGPEVDVADNVKHKISLYYDPTGGMTSVDDVDGVYGPNYPGTILTGYEVITIGRDYAGENSLNPALLKYIKIYKPPEE